MPNLDSPQNDHLIYLFVTHLFVHQLYNLVMLTGLWIGSEDDNNNYVYK